MSIEEELKKLACYCVGNDKFFNRNEAIEYSLKSKIPMTFEVNQGFWDKQDWKNPPSTSLKELYKQRAEQLRNEYDYIILCYSGGADSWNILNTFDINGIHLDEIVSWHNYSITNDKMSKVNSEIFKVAEPTVRQFIEKHPNTTYNLFDYKDFLLNMYKKSEVENYLTITSTIGAPVLYGVWLYEMPRYLDLLNLGKKVCLLWGNDKTLVTHIVDGYYFWFNDTAFNYNMKHLVYSNSMIDENFYWSHKLPSLLLKQCHVLKTVVDSLPANYHDPFPIDIKSKKRVYIMNKNRSLISLPIVNKILYGWDLNTFSEGKPGGTHYFSELDFWATNFLSEDMIVEWKKLVTHHILSLNKINDELKNESNPQFVVHTPVFTSKRFKVG